MYTDRQYTVNKPRLAYLSDVAFGNWLGVFLSPGSGRIGHGQMFMAAAAVVFGASRLGEIRRAAFQDHGLPHR